MKNLDKPQYKSRSMSQFVQASVYYPEILHDRFLKHRSLFITSCPTYYTFHNHNSWYNAVKLPSKPVKLRPINYMFAWKVRAYFSFYKVEWHDSLDTMKVLLLRYVVSGLTLRRCARLTCRHLLPLFGGWMTLFGYEMPRLRYRAFSSVWPTMQWHWKLWFLESPLPTSFYVTSPHIPRKARALRRNQFAYYTAYSPSPPPHSDSPIDTASCSKSRWRLEMKN
jgi:hypothetical protein